MYYFISGLKIYSEVEIWSHAAAPGEVDISIRLGEIPHNRPPATAIGPSWEGIPSELLLTLEGHGLFFLKEGREVIVQILPGGRLENISAYLTSTVFGILCHQRGLMPLHSGAVELDGYAVLFAGDSGAGKSTLTAALHRRGLKILADDINAITISDQEMPTVQSGTPYIRLWQDALHAVGLDKTQYSEEIPYLARYRYKASFSSVDHRLPIGAIYILRELERHHEWDLSSRIEPLNSAQAVREISHNIFRRQVKVTFGQQRQIFSWASRLIRDIPVFAFSRIRDLTQLDSSSSVLQAHMLQTLVSPESNKCPTGTC